ncbi:hypothetical protein EDD84_18775 [Burkholderia gladioli]|nr:hypothetical protein EDD84_18775 [Burkholderia gladioli]
MPATTATCLPESLTLFVRETLRAAALAPTVFDALDITGDALRRIADIARVEVSARLPMNAINWCATHRLCAPSLWACAWPESSFSKRPARNASQHSSKLCGPSQRRSKRA